MMMASREHYNTVSWRHSPSNDSNYSVRMTSHSMELLRNSDVHRYSTRNKDDLRLPSVKRNWGKQRTCYHVFKDWNNLDRGLRNSCTISDFNLKFLKSFLIM